MTLPPAGIGRVKTTVDTNYADPADIDDRASWKLAKRTVDRPRYPHVTVDLLANPDLREQVQALRPGDLILLYGVEPDPVRLHVMAIDWHWGATTVKAALTCVPADVDGRVGRYDDWASRYDSSSSTVAVTTPAAADTVTVTTQLAADCWSVTAVPYYVQVLGERAAVTAVGPTAGTGPFTQQLTVTRSANGVRRSWPAGARIRLAEPVRYGL